MTPLVALIVVVLIGVLAVNLFGRARAGVRSVRHHHRALDTLGHITTQEPAPGAGLPLAPMSPRQAHIRILPPPEALEAEPAVTPEEPDDREPVQLPVAPSFRLLPAPPNELWDPVELRRLLGEADVPDIDVDDVPGADGTGEADDDKEEGAGAEIGTTGQDEEWAASTNGSLVDALVAAPRPGSNGAVPSTSTGPSMNGSVLAPEMNGSMLAPPTGPGVHGSVATTAPGPEMKMAAETNGAATPASPAVTADIRGRGEDLSVGERPKDPFGSTRATAGFAALRRRTRGPGWRRRATATAVVVAATAAGVATFAEEHRPAAKLTVVHPPPAAAARPPAATPKGREPVHRRVVVKLVSSVPGSALYAPGGPARVTLKAVAPCWVEIRRPDAGGQEVYAATMAPGATESVPAPAWIRLGRPQAVALTVGGAAISPPAPPGLPYDVLFS